MIHINAPYYCEYLCTITIMKGDVITWKNGENIKKNTTKSMIKTITKWYH